MEQQTAVEWLFEQIPFEWSSSKAAFEALQQAKQMEKEQIENAWDRGQYIGENFPQRIIEPECENDSEQYYNETYGTDKTT
jgi:hypothetical protein